jgi:glycosyltransferase involved in cell wall biosynthesis
MPIGRALVGHFWEQFVLPLRIRRHAVLWSPCNFGPLFCRRQIVTIHDIAPIDHPEWFRASYRAWFRYIVPKLIERAVAITTVSSFTQERLSSRFRIDSDSITLVPNGCDFQRARRLASARKDAALVPPPFVLAVGSSDPRKNVVGIESALQTVRGARPTLRLAVVGGGAMDVFAKGSLLNDPLDVRLGHVTDAELVQLYRNASCLVYASFYEGFGLPPLEAMALGTRVVASRLPSIEEICADCVIYIDPSDPADIARGINEALSESCDQRQAATERALGRARQYSWVAAAEKMDELARMLWTERGSELTPATPRTDWSEY